MLLSALLHPHSGSAQTTAITYQGFLTENGGPAQGIHDLRFTIYDAVSAGGAVGSPLAQGDVVVTNGLFTVTLDFGGTPFTGAALWLDIAVRPGASVGSYTNLVPRQPITSAPYAIKAASAMTVTMGAITDPSFIGTTTAAPLQLLVSNTVGLRLEYPTEGTVPNLVGGFSGNSVGAGTEGAVIAGGGRSGLANSIGVNSDYSTIGGGQINNIASNSSATTIAGGLGNDTGVSTFYSTIGGGLYNNISSNSSSATIAGGRYNDIGVNADSSTIGGGQENNIGLNSEYSTIPGGLNNAVGANAGYAFAAGYRAKANHYGSFIWADFTEADFATTRANQFAIRAGGGVRVEGGTDAEPGSGGFLTLGSTSAVNLVLDNNEIMARNNGAPATLSLNFDGGAVVTGGALGVNRNPAVNALEVEGNASKTTSGSWLANSDVRIKKQVQPITSALDTLNQVRLVSFRYTDDYLAQHRTIENRRYLNVIAQEFAQVFPEHVKSSGEKLPDGSEILQVDIHPLTIYSAAAVQELNRKVEAMRTENTTLKSELAELKRMMETLIQNGTEQ